jgi:hypothetical protein
MTSSLDTRPQRLDLKLYGGDDTVIRLTVLDSAGAPLDLSAGELLAQVRPKPGDDELTCTPVLDTTEAALGVVYLLFAAACTRALAAGKIHAWDLRYRVAGLDERLCSGTIHAQPEVTVDP